MELALRRQKRFAIAVVLFLVGGFAVWSSRVEIASATVAPGVVSPEGSKRPVQHLEGGIVAEVLVKDGQRVEAGQPLLVMEDIRARSELDILRNQKLILEMRLERLEAERRGSERFAPAHVLQSDDNLARAIESEIQQFLTRKGSLDTQVQVLATRMLQHREAIGSFTLQIKSLEAQRLNTGRLLEMTSKLAAAGLVSKVRLLEVENQVANVEGQLAAAAGQVERSKKLIVETENEISNVRSKFLEDVDAQISTVRAEVVRIDNGIDANADVVARTVISAQESGIIIGLRVAAPKTVVKPGEIVVEIVPDDAKLLIDARISPMDVDDVQLGQTAFVQLSAYHQRQMPRLAGHVLYLSADRLTDERSGLPYFLARIEIEPNHLAEEAPRVEVLAGMPAEIMIQTGQRTLFEYLVEPLSQSINRAFREH